jgi:hypothetical protein
LSAWAPRIAAITPDDENSSAMGESGSIIFSTWVLPYAEAFLELLGQFEELQESLDAIAVPIVSGEEFRNLRFLGLRVRGRANSVAGNSEILRKPI